MKTHLGTDFSYSLTWCGIHVFPDYNIDPSIGLIHLYLITCKNCQRIFNAHKRNN